jgi:energy-coupling factor transporter ATP-binding protein EcfA2
VTGPAIRIVDLHYAYPPAVPATSDAPPSEGMGNSPALRGISLTVQPGEFVALMGAVGAGKTTLCLALNGLVPQSTGGVFRGDVWIGDYNTKRQPVAELSTRVGVVFQEPESQLFNMTVEDEVAFGPESLGLPASVIEQRITWALDAVGLSALRQRSPAELSGGQQQRLALAAILAMQPAVLVLDEPTAGLDPLGRTAVLDAVAGLRRQGMAVVMATQDADAVATLANRVVVLAAGRVALDGPPGEVFGQVDSLHALGINVPQPVELSVRLGINPPWLTVDQAVQALQLSPEVIRMEAHIADRFSRPSTGHSEDARVDPCESARRGRSAAVVFTGVTFRYGSPPAAGRETVPALDGIDLTLDTGEFVALIGANGSGKTTLARHINGLLQPQAGHVVVEGADTRQVSTGILARTVGYVFQNPDHQIFAPTVRSEIAFGPRNLGLGRDEVERRVVEALEAFQLTALADLPPAALGYGVRRLVTLASVHAMQPNILVLDEPTGGLDRALTARLVAWVDQRHAAGATVVFITHDMVLAALAPRCVVLAGGRVVLDGPTGAVFARTDALIHAGIVPPPLANLAQRLGWPGTPLTVDDFCSHLTTPADGIALAVGGILGRD